MLDGVELKKNYVLNPLAPEFVPRSKRFYRDSFLQLMHNAIIMNEASRCQHLMKRFFRRHVLCSKVSWSNFLAKSPFA
jgi:hypothetical protein